MATLRTAINAKIADLTAQIKVAKQVAKATIDPLQIAIYAEQEKLVRFAPWLDQDQALVPEQIAAVILFSPKA